MLIDPENVTAIKKPPDRPSVEKASQYIQHNNSQFGIE
jgi:hypothetical protein